MPWIAKRSLLTAKFGRYFQIASPQFHGLTRWTSLRPFEACSDGFYLQTGTPSCATAQAKAPWGHDCAVRSGCATIPRVNHCKGGLRLRTQRLIAQHLDSTEPSVLALGSLSKGRQTFQDTFSDNQRGLYNILGGLRTANGGCKKISAMVAEFVLYRRPGICMPTGKSEGMPGVSTCNAEEHMKSTYHFRPDATIAIAALFSTVAASAAVDPTCAALPNQAALKAALVSAVVTETTGLNLQMWATIVNRDGVVCAVAFSGVDRAAQWPGSRIISAQKANTANAFSLDASSGLGNNSGAVAGLALSTANLYSPTQPGGSLFGLQESNPVETLIAYSGPAVHFGQFNDPMVGRRIGGINVFGGGLALYGGGKVVQGAVGVSGDTSCADHRIAWRVRKNLGLDHLAGVGGVSGDIARPDNIVYLTSGEAPNGFKHPNCGGGDDPASLPAVQP